MNTAAQIGHALTSEAEAVRIFTLQRAAHREHPIPSLEIRRKNLKRLEMMLLENQDAICAAISQDCGFHAIRPPSPRSSGRAFHAHLAICSTTIRTGSRSAATQGGIVSLRCPASSISSPVCASTHP